MFNYDKWNTLQKTQPVFAEETIKIAILNHEYKYSKAAIYDNLPDAEKALFQRRKKKIISVLVEKHIITSVLDLSELAKKSV